MKEISRLNRREILERMAIVSGGLISLTVLSACEGGVSVDKSAKKDTALKSLSQEQLGLIGDIADTIIPDTETPGAKAINIHYFIDELVANWMTSVQRNQFLSDVSMLDTRIKSEKGKSFSMLSLDDRGLMLDQLGEEMIEQNAQSIKHIYKEIRELTIFGYYTSEVGASVELNFDPLPGAFKGCVPFSDVGKTWSVGS